MSIQVATLKGSLSGALIGTWELLTREDRTSDGELRIEPSLGANPIALLFFDGHGHFAAQFMNRERGKTPSVDISGPISNNSRARDGYDAYFGTYQVDELVGSVTTKLSAALSPENVGQVFTRKMDVSGDELTIQLATSAITGEAVIRTLRWKRIG
jgi:lipocalin-like protein